MKRGEREVETGEKRKRDGEGGEEGEERERENGKRKDMKGERTHLNPIPDGL